MGFVNTNSVTLLLLLITASLWATSMADKDAGVPNKEMNMKQRNNGWWGGWGWSWNYTSSPHQHNRTSRWSWNYTSRVPPYHYNHNWSWNCNDTTGRQWYGPKSINIGDSNNWRFGFNYSEWAFKNGPFYLRDILVFKYEPPSNGSHPHSVYLLPDFWSYLNCDFRRAKRLASPTEGTGRGFQFKLKRWQPYYFACGESNGFHCSNGGMKFSVMPLFRY